MNITALIADDEELARRKLRELLSEVTWVECVGEVEDGEAAVRALDELRPDLIFLDVQMPELSGLEVLERSQHKPAVVFTTAYDKYAVAAFELQAVDYLLKPFGRERFLKALERVHSMLSERDVASPIERARWALSPTGPITKLFVRSRGNIIPISVSEIERLEARGDYIVVHLSGRTYLIHVPLRELERHLDSDRFVRIHRSHIVNIDYVKALVPYDAARLEIEMTNGTRLMASRTRSRVLKRLAL